MAFELSETKVKRAIELTRETVQLERETAERELAAFAKAGKPAKRSIHEEARSVWNRMNGGSEDMLYAGDFDQ